MLLSGRRNAEINSIYYVKRDCVCVCVCVCIHTISVIKKATNNFDIKFYDDNTES